MRAQVFARPAPQMSNPQLLIENLQELYRMMRSTAQYMEHMPDPAPQHAMELFGAARIVRSWVRSMEDDWK